MINKLSSQSRLILMPVLLGASLAAAPAAAQPATPPEPASGGPIEVQVSFFLVDILRILDAEQTVEADLFFRIEWLDERLAEEGAKRRTMSLDSVWHPILQPLSPRGLSELMPEVLLVGHDGRVSYTQRLVGKFGAATNLRDFPFDEHSLGFQFVIPNLQDIQLEVIPGPIVGRAKSLSIPDWTIRGGELDLTPVAAIDALPPVPGASFVVEARRNRSHYVTKVILPLVVIVMISWTVFWTPSTQIAVQFGFAATSVLTVIAYRFALASQLPPVPYSTRLDIFLNGAFIMVALALVEVVVTAQLIYKERTAAARKVDVLCRAAFPFVLLLIAGYSFLL